MSTTPDTRSRSHRICPVEELPPGGVRIARIGRYGVGVFNVDGRFHALSNYCPHRGAPLCLGEIEGTVRAGDEPYRIEWEREGECLRCPWHGWEFDIATGRALARTEVRAKTWPVSIVDGYVVVEEGR